MPRHMPHHHPDILVLAHLRSRVQGHPPGPCKKLQAEPILHVASVPAGTREQLGADGLASNEYHTGGYKQSALRTRPNRQIVSIYS